MFGQNDGPTLILGMINSKSPLEYYSEITSLMVGRRTNREEGRSYDDGHGNINHEQMYSEASPVIILLAR